MTSFFKSAVDDLPMHTFHNVAWAAAVWTLCFAADVAQGAASEPAAPRRTELIRLVHQDCGSCHGLTLKGGLGPALLPDALANKPGDSLKATILFGRPGSAMPPWQRFLSESEAEWIVQNLQRGFPNER